MLLWENRLLHEGAEIIIGLDEAGRGPLAGPVVACAIILDLAPGPCNRTAFQGFHNTVKDSKKMSPASRERAFEEISAKSVYALGIQYCRTIDKYNIREATGMAMKKAVNEVLKRLPKEGLSRRGILKKNVCVIADAGVALDLPYKVIQLVRGESQSLSIAAASVIAKVSRDNMMTHYHKLYPLYNFISHKGYGTKAHMQALEKYGPCPIHRKSFAPVRYIYDGAQG